MTHSNKNSDRDFLIQPDSHESEELHNNDNTGIALQARRDPQ